MQQVSISGSEKYHWDRLKKMKIAISPTMSWRSLLITSNSSLEKEASDACTYLEDNTEVAVKIRSEKSSHGFNEFLAEVPKFWNMEV